MARCLIQRSYDQVASWNALFTAFAEGRFQEARAQLSILRCVIEEVIIEPLDEESRAEVELLRTQEQKLRAMLFGSGCVERP